MTAYLLEVYHYQIPLIFKEHIKLVHKIIHDRLRMMDPLRPSSFAPLALLAAS